MTITWKVDSLEAKVSENGLSNVISTIHWRANGTDGQNFATRYGSVAVGSPAPESFTPYDHLDEVTVVNWVLEALGEEKVNEIEAGISGELAALSSPSTITPALPWA
jgi:hypothetical protein